MRSSGKSDGVIRRFGLRHFTYPKDGPCFFDGTIDGGGCFSRPAACSGRRAVALLRGALGALLAAVLTAGCEDVRHDYFPLEVGSSWTYRVVSEGRVRETDSIRVLERLEYTWTEEGGEPLTRPSAGNHGDRAERFRVKEPTGVVVWSAVGRKPGRDVFRISPGGETVTTIIKYPPFVGFGWTDRGPGGRLVYCKVVGREAVETPADWFFDCVVVERQAQDFSSVVRQWFAPDVGLVKWRVERPGRPAFEWLLEEYTTPGR